VAHSHFEDFVVSLNQFRSQPDVSDGSRQTGSVSEIASLHAVGYLHRWQSIESV